MSKQLEVEPEFAEKISSDDLGWLLEKLADRVEKEIVLIAKNPNLYRRIERIVFTLPTRHIIYHGDSRNLSFIPSESVHLVVNSPPYWIVKKYKPIPGQLGVIKDYNKFLEELGKVWREVYRVLVPGGRLIIVVGDVLLPRRKYGRHRVIPLHSDIIKQCTSIGFEYLAPIIWFKIGNVSREVPGRSGFLGKPYMPNAVIKNDIEYILMFRKPGYRSVSRVRMKLSVIPEKLFKEWFTQIWRLLGESTKHHPAPFPLELAERLIRMYSYVYDTVLDPFMGTGTTLLAAARTGRNSIGVEIDPEYVKYAYNRLRKEAQSLFGKREIILKEMSNEQSYQGMG
ncbi:DNA-methyltransferase [Staphylothermus hellenicus]|uniref:Type II methyltransferase n=1 Tax=Staphylothermus hellenicus (strain DSM 12710 / JCM 10830 / BK20S6-10-b1 / P8) TaxID=591019 RepID=D7DAQ7_STAHD|nr:site-specific DNA-methyltransferase [Staphylothermus hellenicus]ADI31254.1 DNA methylase N-4/N-6 domain protein [Staphylothermus hellenicus DSM 12710]